MISAPRIFRPAGRLLAAGTLLTAATALVGCAQIPSSDRASCAPTELFAVERSGEGSGPRITDDGVATMRISVDFADGRPAIEDVPVSPNPDGTPGAIRVGALLPGIVELARCAAAGETVSATMTEAEFSGSLQPGADPNAEQTVTIAVDRVYHSAASGRIAPQQNGIPAVVNAPGGGHGVTMPAGAPPTELRVAETISGFGTPIAEGDVVLVDYSLYSWTDGELITSSWSGVQPERFAAADNDDPFGLSPALVGLANGSQLVLVVPGERLAAAGMAVVDPGDAVVMVVDVLGVER